MTEETNHLLYIADELTKNKKSDGCEPSRYLINEARRLERVITDSLMAMQNSTQRETLHFNILSKLVNICDLLFDATKSVDSDVMTMIDLLAAIRRIVPDGIRPNLKLPKAFIELQRNSLSAFWTQQSELLASYGIRAKLIEIAGLPFARFTEPKQILYWGDYTWLKGYQSKLDIMDWQDTDCNSPEEALLSLLIGRDFNDDRFYIYCKKYIQQRTNKISGKRNRLLEYALCEKLVLEDTQTGTAPFDPRANNLNARLIKWIREEIDFVETHEREGPLSKFEFKWNVEAIAFFFKLLWDHKVFGKVSLEPLSEQIAANCSSVGKDEFQATTIFSRFYVKDAAVLRAVEKVLSEMLEDVRRFL